MYNKTRVKIVHCFKTSPPPSFNTQLPINLLTRSLLKWPLYICPLEETAQLKKSRA